MTDFHVSYPSKEDSSMRYNCPEVPERTKNIHAHLQDLNLLELMHQIELDDLTPKTLKYLEQTILSLNHSQEYV